MINVVDRLLFIVKPNYMFLGEKDFQQFFLIKKYIKNKFKTKIVLCKTIRDKRYIPLSSRNKLLTKKNLTTVSKISIKLNLLKKKIKKNFKHINKINYIKNLITKKYNVKFDYLEARNEYDLSNIKKNKKFRLFVAYHIGGVRLIDNF